MKTLLQKVSATEPEEGIIRRAGETLRHGGIVAFPTETVYGLGANALDTNAVRKVFEAKGRPSDNPLIVHIASRDDLPSLISEMPAYAMELMGLFFPGPLTLIFRRSALVSDAVTCGLDTVAVRMPDHPVALALIRAAGTPLVAPSANRSGKPSPTSASHVLHDLDGKVEMILDGGATRLGIESSVVDLTVAPPMLLRKGGVSIDRLKEVLPILQLPVAIESLMRSPGTRYKHYAPSAIVGIVPTADGENLKSRLQHAAEEQLIAGCYIHSPVLREIAIEAGIPMEFQPSLPGFARELFSTLRAFDAKGVQLILIEAVAEKGIGVAVMDRIRRAASVSS